MAAVVALCALPVLANSQALPPSSPPPLPPGGLPATPPPPPANLPDPSEMLQQLKQLEELLGMTPEQLDKLSQTISYIRQMDGSERSAMRIRLRQLTQMTPELRTEIAQLSSYLPQTYRKDFSQFWLAAEASERQDFRERIAELESSDISDLLLLQVQQFVQIRDSAFEKMREQLRNRPAPPPQN